MTERRPIEVLSEAPILERRGVRPFFVLRELPCPYLSGRYERKIITDLSGVDAQDVHSDLSRGGFRRSHMFAYRPACTGCSACVPVRVPVAAHRPTKSQRRSLNRNQDLRVSVQLPKATEEQFNLFTRYLSSRHQDGEMAEMSWDDYRQMVEETSVETRIAEFRDRDTRLVGGCLFDRLDDGLSAVYSFYEPADSQRSLGTFMVLWLIAETRRYGGDFLYLGYWVRESPKMAYKSRFQPLQALTVSGWSSISTQRWS